MNAPLALVKLQKATFILLLFLLPTQLGLHFWPEWAHVFGIRIDYLAPTLYLTDIFVLSAGGLWAFEHFLRKDIIVPWHRLFLILLLFLFATCNVYFSQNQPATLFKWLKVVEFSFLVFLVAKRVDNKTLHRALAALLVSTVFFSVIGDLQYIFQRSLGGVAYLFGERLITPTTPGVALVTLGGVEKLRAYSVFSHPNSFAGFLVATLPIFFGRVVKRNHVFWIAVLAVSGAVILTFSRSGIFALVAVLVFLVWKNMDIARLMRLGLPTFVVASLVMTLVPPLVITGQRTVNERVVFARAAGELFSLSPVVGVGLNNFLVRAHGVVETNPLVWQFQPVHSIFLLSLVEGGMVGLLLVVYLFWLIVKKCDRWVCLSILVVLLTGTVDHYWFTLQQNQLLFSLVIGLSLRANEKY